MGALYPGLPIAFCLAVFGLLARHALEMRGKKNYREMWGSLSLSLLPGAVFCLWVASGESSMVTRNIYLIPIGALLGACAFAWAGYVFHDMRAAQAQALSPAESGAQPSGGKNVVNIPGSNNTVSIGHIGDVTINQAPAPQLILSAVQRMQNPDGSVLTVIEASVIAPYPPAGLELEAWGPGIIEFNAQQQRPGMQMTGWTGVREDHAFTSVQSPSGRYRLNIRTKTATNVEIRYKFN